MTTTLYGWGPMFNLPGPSPFVLKTDIQLQMLGVSFERAIADLESVKKHKAPYVKDGEQTIEDSTFIRSHFETKLGRSLDASLSSEERAVAWAVERLLEDRLSFIMAQERWLEADNFNRGPAKFFAAVPQAMRGQVCEQVLGELRSMLVRHGIGRHTRAERMELAGRDIAAVAALLGNKPFVCGEVPTAVDAATFGVLASCGTRFFDSPLPDLVDAHPMLRPYLKRMEARFFTQVSWPSAQ
jgi:glutathione S-transferase